MFKITTNASLQDDQQVSNYHSRLEGDDDEELEDNVEIPNESSTNKMWFKDLAQLGTQTLVQS